ncbi:NAD(P)H-hydrate dehydratase [Mycoplasmatota bacterium]|nr:NAD(P)H-hydrate dehydratase [Mycoplasmatota bacterium]
MSIHNVLTTKEMKILDVDTCYKKGISSLELMEDAGEKIYECFLDECKLDKKQANITIISGLGNNGGDSLVVGRYLIENDYNVDVVIVGDMKYLSSETKTNLERLISLKVNIFNLNHPSSIKPFEDIISKTNVIIEGLFGIGLNRGIEGITYQAIEKINAIDAYVFSIDIPSGINGNNGNVENIAVKADFTGIVQNYKLGNLLNDALDYHGKSKVLDVGILQDKITSNRYLQTDIPQLGKRKHNTHKYHYGHVLTIGGGLGMTGAPLMCAYAALRIGSGLSSVAIHENYINYLNNIYPEIMIKPYVNEESIVNMLDKKKVIAFGPGLGRSDNRYINILNQLLETEIPLVIDADGIYYLKGLLEKLNHQQVIITPHLGEMAMLLGKETSYIKENPIEAVNLLTNKYRLTVVLKGPCTIIANQDEMFFSHIGNPGMATAGSGDVLTGIISSLVGQGMDSLNACRLGVHIHSSAGNYAKDEFGEYAMVATDIIKNVPKVLKELVDR